MGKKGVEDAGGKYVHSLILIFAHFRTTTYSSRSREAERALMREFTV